jgi:pantoate--beta-alanine ligase
MNVVTTPAGLMDVRAAFGGARVGVVMTMGALHAGHMALIEAARAENDHVIATIFVNPTQFLPTEDLNDYPRPFERDRAMLEAAGVDCLFAPTPAVMYPPGHQTRVTPGAAADGLEGEARPGHFQGVATVVTMLLNLTRPTAAYFGQKDAQQVVVIRQMVRDLFLSGRIVVIPTVREADGLAMSSRNAYLDDYDRQEAPCVYAGLRSAAAAYDAGERRVRALVSAVSGPILRNILPVRRYIALNDPRTLAPFALDDMLGDTPVLISCAVSIRSVRLIDNLLLPAHLNTRDGLDRWLGGPPDADSAG